MTLQHLSDTQRKVLFALQEDLAAEPRPYDAPAKHAGLSVEEFLEVAHDLVEAGYLRKMAALVNHYRVGFQSNAMCIWELPAERVDEAAAIMAAFKEVTHCYRRPVSDRWRHALFCMVHGRNRTGCEEVVRRIADAVKPDDYQIIYSVAELKKRSLRLPL